MAGETIIHDTTVVTADDAGSIHHDAAVVVAGGRIVAIGPSAELLPRYPSAERVRATATARSACRTADGSRRATAPTSSSSILARPHLAPVLRGVSAFVHQGQAADVASVMVDGRWVMREGRVLTLDESTVVAEAERVARTAWRRLFDARPDLTPPPGFDLRRI